MNKKKKRWRLFFWTLLSLVLLAVLAVIVLGMRRAFTYEAPQIEQAGQAVHAGPTPTPGPALEASAQQLTQTLNILLLGIDSINGIEEETRGNADGIVLATINPHTKELIFTSFMRDTRVRVRDSGYDKLTNVYHTGGLALLTEVLEENFAVDVDYYALFTSADVAAIVDAVGGVEIDVSMEEIYFMEPKIRSISIETGTAYEDNALSVDQAGVLTLNGVQAAAYSRIRPAEGGYDAGRTERVRDVLAKVLGKAFRLPYADMVQFAGVFLKTVTTDIPDELFMTLAVNASELRQYNQISDRIPIDGAYQSENTGSGYYVVPDLTINNKHLQDSIYKGIHE